jgi:hypothetical protein
MSFRQPVFYFSAKMLQTEKDLPRAAVVKMSLPQSLKSKESRESRAAARDSRSHDAVIRVYHEAGNVIETHEHAGGPSTAGTDLCIARSLQGGLGARH